MWLTAEKSRMMARSNGRAAISLEMAAWPRRGPGSFHGRSYESAQLVI
jgi:hypothetical protein